MEKLEFEYTWADRSRFPTYEPNEDQVRADLQYHPNAIKDFINGMLDALAGVSGADSIGMADENGTASTVQEQLAPLVAIRYSLDALINSFGGKEVVTDFTSATDDTVPTTAAVQRAMDDLVIEAGSADMFKIMYDPDHHETDIFYYIDKQVLEHEADYENPHRVSKEQLGLENVDNTSDLDKPISSAVQAALNLKFEVGGNAVIPVANGGTGASSASTARKNLGIRSGTALPTSASTGDIFILYKN